jgi:hypothetical protein
MGVFITEDAEDTEGTEEIEGRRVSLIAEAPVHRNAGISSVPSVSSASSVMKTLPQQVTRRYSLRGKRKLAGSRAIRRRIAP